MLVSGFSDWVPRKKELLKGRFASHQPQCKPEATAIKVNVGTAMKIQFETGVTFQSLYVEVLQCPQLPCFEPCRFLPSLQPHHNTQPSSKSISDFFSQLGSCSKPAKNLSFPLLQCEALKCWTIPVLGGSPHSSLIWLSSLLNRACIEHSFPTLSERSFTTHFFMLSGASGSSCSYIKKRHCLFLPLKIIVSHGSKPWA